MIEIARFIIVLNMFGLEIGQRESGFYSERTDTQTHRVTQPSSTVLVYRYVNLYRVTEI